MDKDSQQERRGRGRGRGRGRRRHGPLAPHPTMWAALEHGPGLRTVLEDFYSRVFADPLLAPFFAGLQQSWLVDKQYNFLCSIFTGERVYFGARPRNAHHWMVISNEIFDHRENLLEECLRRYGLPEPLIADFRRLDEVFRKHIVKDHPRPLRVGGMDLPLDGHESVTLSAGILCDRCSREIDSGHTAFHHIRSGHAYCPSCHEHVLHTADPQ